MNPENDKKRALEWFARAKRAIDAGRLVVLDFETTGKANFKTGYYPEPCSIALYWGGGEFASYLKPKVEFITDEAGAIHGITPEKVENAPTFADVYPRLLEIMESKVVVAYNAAFEQGVIRRAFAMWGVAPIYARYECAMINYADYFQEPDKKGRNWKWQKLTDAFERHCMNRQGAKELLADAHDALADVKMTWELILQLAESEV